MDSTSATRAANRIRSKRYYEKKMTDENWRLQRREKYRLRMREWRGAQRMPAPPTNTENISDENSKLLYDFVYAHILKPKMC